MKMTNLEKILVNNSMRSRQVSRYAEKMLKWIDLKAGQKYLDFGS